MGIVNWTDTKIFEFIQISNYCTSFSIVEPSSGADDEVLCQQLFQKYIYGFIPDLSFSVFFPTFFFLPTHLHTQKYTTSKEITQEGRSFREATPDEASPIPDEGLDKISMSIKVCP
ncbi:unnamed protein product [Allacma fusca]|uniref:Uncharacterized protein n=1 Tax=Allacma fusca TaxID=39272 RepID=A0A8J2KEM4_9HEXA|nr:unnamed protein product [Allacma fusca]